MRVDATLSTSASFAARSIATGRSFIDRVDPLEPKKANVLAGAKSIDSGIRSVVTVPVIVGDELPGVVQLRSPYPDAFTQDSVALLELVAIKVAPAIKRLESVITQQSFAKSGKTANQKLDTVEIYKRLAAELFEVIQFQQLTVTGWNPDWSTIEYVRGQNLGDVGESGAHDSDFSQSDRHEGSEGSDQDSGRSDPSMDLPVEFGFNSRVQVLVGPPELPTKVLTLIRVAELGVPHTPVSSRITPAITTTGKSDAEAVVRLESELAESQSRYRDLYDNAMNMLFSVSLETGLITDCNQEVLEEFGYTSEEFIGMHRLQLFPPESHKHANALWAKFKRTGLVTGAEVRAVRSDGSNLIVSIRERAIRDRTGQIVSSHSVWRDVTEDVRFRTSFEQAQHALDSTTDMVVIHDLDTRCLYVNDAFVIVTGYDRDDVVGRFPPIQGSEQRNESPECWAVAKAGQVWSGTYPAYRKDGTMYDEQSTLAPVFDDRDEISSFVAIKRDITDMLEADHLISQSLAEQELISVVEHELRSPLAAVINFVDLLRKSDGSRPEILESLKSSTSALATAISDLGSLKSDAAARLSMNSKYDNISVLLDDAISRSTALIAKKKLNLKVTVDNDPAVVKLEIDSYRITQVFSNLITNAVRYSSSGSNIEIELDRCANFTRFRIYNEGAGVSDSELEMVTHPYFSGSQSRKSQGTGSGIGLALSAAIVKSHGGYMNVRSKADEFFEVEVLLPNPSLG